MREVRGFGDAVVTPHVLSTQAAMEMFAIGGSAADAMVAADAVQGVVAPETCGIGGDLFALVYTPGMERPETLNASGPAGSNADPEELRAEGHEQMPPRHPVTVTVPGCVAGWATLLDRFGRLPLDRILSPAIRLTNEGFPASTEYTRATADLTDLLRRHAPGAQLYPGVGVTPSGARIVRPHLGDTLRQIADKGPLDGFYGGRAGEAISEAVDGRITIDDLTGFAPEWVEPVRLDVFGLTGWTIPPNSQGYITLGTLHIFESIVGDIEPQDPGWTHLLIEAYRSMAWDRNEVLADPRFAPLDTGQLLAHDRLAARAAEIDPSRVGMWPQAAAKPGGTAYFCAVGADGMAVSFIQSNFWGVGSGIGAGDAGFILHNRGGGFDLRPGHPNELAPGKRPLHTLSPTLWTRAGELAAVLGTRGGEQQPQLLSQMAAWMFGAGLTPGTAQDVPRWTVDDFGPHAPSVVLAESTMPPSILDGLYDRGHDVRLRAHRMGGWGPVSTITVGPEGLRTAAADPRVDTTSAAAR